jgi:hypothetical protein
MRLGREGMKLGGGEERELTRTYGVMVSTLDFESNNPSSILGMSFFLDDPAETLIQDFWVLSIKTN